MTDAQGEHYKRLESVLTRELKAALRAGSNSLLGVVMNALPSVARLLFSGGGSA